MEADALAGCLPNAVGSLTLPKRLLDYALKDKKHARFPAELSLTLVYRATALPREYLWALHSGGTD